MPDTEFTLNTQDFDKKWAEYLRTVPEAVRLGIFSAMTRLEKDALEEPPTVPKGPQGKKRYTPGQLRKQTEIQAKAEGDVAEGTLIYKMPYAARRHEEEHAPVSGLPIKFSEPGSGAKFIETKLVRHKDSYVQLIASEIKSRTGG